MVKRPAERPSLTPDLQRSFAADLFNHVWTLLEKPGRSSAEDELMVHAAHASCFLWHEIGEAVNHARGEWQVSRVYSTLGRGEPALHHARRCLAICEEHAIGDFDLAYAYEAMARAHATAGERSAAARYLDLAAEAGARIEEEDDRQLFESELATIDT